MSIELIVPRYSHRNVSVDERLERKVSDPLDPDEKIPDRCGGCGVAGSFGNPLMGTPFFRMEHGGPRGTLYQVMCSQCMQEKAKRRWR